MDSLNDRITTSLEDDVRFDASCMHMEQMYEHQEDVYTKFKNVTLCWFLLYVIRSRSSKLVNLL